MEKKILLIEDDFLIREMYESELIRAGYKVTACSSGEDGIKALPKDHFDLALLDIMLPGINGLEVLKQIKQNPQTKDIRVVLLTNLGYEAAIKKGFDLGAVGYLIKSAYTPDQVIKEIKSFIDGTNLSVSPI